MERCNEIRVPSEEAVQLVEYCIQNGYKISTAESCTGKVVLYKKKNSKMFKVKIKT